MKQKRTLLKLSGFWVLLFSGCSQPMGYGHMGSGWHTMMGDNIYGGFFMWIILLVIIAGVVYFIFSQNKQTGNTLGLTRETPMDILKKRYAKGEISKEEFEDLKKDLEA